MSINGGITREDENDEYKCASEAWMRESLDDRIKESFLLRNGNLIVKLEDDEGVNDYENAKPMNNMPSHFGSYILTHSKRSMNDVTEQIGGFYNKSIY